QHWQTGSRATPWGVGWLLAVLSMNTLGVTGVRGMFSLLAGQLAALAGSAEAAKRSTSPRVVAPTPSVGTRMSSLAARARVPGWRRPPVPSTWWGSVPPAVGPATMQYVAELVAPNHSMRRPESDGGKLPWEVPRSVA